MAAQVLLSFNNYDSCEVSNTFNPIVHPLQINLTTLNWRLQFQTTLG